MSTFTRADERSATTPADITAAVLASFAGCADERLGSIMSSLIEHLHAFVASVGLTEFEWQRAIEILTDTGHIADEHRQEWILWSDTLGVSMLVDALAHQTPRGTTESTVLGPFYVPDSPRRQYGARFDEMPAGIPAWVHGTVRSVDGTPLAGAELNVWQNGDNELYALQDPAAPEHTGARVLFGTGTASTVPAEAQRLGQRCLLILDEVANTIAGDLRQALEPLTARIIDRVRQHVPVKDAESARGVARASAAVLVNRYPEAGETIRRALKSTDAADGLRKLSASVTRRRPCRSWASQPPRARHSPMRLTRPPSASGSA